jgi:hypothetical protein
MVVIRTSDGASVISVQFLLNSGRYWDRTSDPHNVNRVSLVESYDSWSFDLWRCDSHGNL